MALPLLTFCVQSELVSQLDRLMGETGRDRAYHLLPICQYWSGSRSRCEGGIREVEAERITSSEDVKEKERLGEWRHWSDCKNSGLTPFSLSSWSSYGLASHGSDLSHQDVKIKSSFCLSRQSSEDYRRSDSISDSFCWSCHIRIKSHSKLYLAFQISICAAIQGRLWTRLLRISQQKT